MSKLNQFIRAATRSPFLWGVLGSVGFYALVHASPLESPLAKLVKRYFAGHPVEYIETILFAIGMASLIVKMLDTVAQRAGLGSSLLSSATSTPEPIERCDALLDRLDHLPEQRRGEYYVSRLRSALEHVRRSGSADSLDDELKYLSDLDAARAHSGHAMFRVIVWAIPILGFLGTVLGITAALSSVDLHAVDQSMLKVLDGLGLTFDTTALALALAMILMFVHFYVERAETALLEQVDQRVQIELTGRFATTPNGGDGQQVAFRRMAESMMKATEYLVQRQAELWQASVESAARQWAEMAGDAGEHVKVAMSAATGELASHARVLQNAVEATGQIVNLESALNHNLDALAGAKHFEQTVLSLAAAVNMLSARLAETPNAAVPVRLNSTQRSSNAA